MKHLLFTVYDEKAEVYLPPFFVPTIGIATRAFTDSINSGEHHFGKHPADYTLFQIGEFDDHDASIITENRKTLGNGVEYITPEVLKPTELHPNDPSNPSIQPDKNR